MKTISKVAKSITFVVLVGIAGFIIGKYITAKKQEPPVIYNVVQQIKEVSKITIAESSFSYIYPYRDYVGWDIDILSKKALVVVNGKVSYGYDLSESISIDTINKILTIKKPETKILSVDLVPQVYDVTSNFLLTLTVDDYNKISQQIRSDIEGKASTYIKMEVIKNNHIDMVKLIANNAGWKIVE